MSLENLVGVYAEATPQEMQEGMAWYDQAHEIVRDLATKHDMPIEVVAGAMAALSPRVRWSSNIKDTKALLDAWAKGETDVPLTAFRRNQEKAVAIIEGQSTEPLSGDKVCSFAKCIADPGHPDEVVIDTHAYNAWAGDRVICGGKGPRVAGKRYKAVAEDYRLLAKIMGTSPSQAQAVVWLTWKRMIGEERP